MDNVYQQTDVPGLRKNKSNGVIINEDLGKYEMIKAKRKAVKEHKSLQDGMEQLHSKVCAMEQDIEDIRQFLKTLR